MTKCNYCGQTMVINIGAQQHCFGCFSAGARSTEMMYAKIQEHIAEEAKKWKK